MQKLMTKLSYIYKSSISNQWKASIREMTPHPVTCVS